MKTDTQDILSVIANNIRGLAIDAIDACNSGHPGLPLGCAEILSVLYGTFLIHNPADPNWANRDRFVLSAGHGSMGLYAALHLAGFDLTQTDIQNFRKLGSKTPGHPEVHETPGVETTTGPLGQGIATAVGMALSAKHIQARTQAPLDYQVVALVGDGCLMEGVSAEAASFAGHLKLDNLIVIYDSNDICLDGPTTECFTENVEARFVSYGWHTQIIDGHDLNAIDQALRAARANTSGPTLIICKTTIGFGSPTYAGTSEAHGKPFGPVESANTKMALGIPTSPLFYVSESVQLFFKNRLLLQQSQQSEWELSFKNWTADFPENAAIWKALSNRYPSETVLNHIRNLEIKANIATRASSQAVIQAIHSEYANLIGGSADLSCSDSTFIKAGGIVSRDHYGAQNIKYGVREFAMGAIASGLALSGHLKPFCGTFLTFSDYMKNAVRLAALMNLPVVYQFTHDSILLGEDGPTHQPIEQLASLRSIPNLTVIRPADATEIKAAWIYALQSQGPVALILSRQGIKDGLPTDIHRLQHGGYIISETTSGSVDYTLIATGSELALAVDTASALHNLGKSTRVVSMPSFELFNQQPVDYKARILGNTGQRISIEAQSSFGWHQYIGIDGIAISVDTFGLSGSATDLAAHFGFTVPAILNRLGLHP